MRAGRLVKVAVYSRSTAKADTLTRQKRKAATRTAQRFLNCRNQTERLSLLIAANFDTPDSVFATLTYDNKYLPNTKKEVKKQFEAWAREMRKALSMRGKAFSYIRSVEGTSLSEQPEALDPRGLGYETRPWNVTEKWEAEGLNIDRNPKGKKQSNVAVRFHSHIITNLSTAEYEIARSLWPFGHVYIAKIRTKDSESFPKLASYMTKDTRNGDTGNGERCYSCSKGLMKPHTSGEWVESDNIEIPSGAKKFENSWDGSSEWSYCHRVGYIEEYRAIKQYQLDPCENNDNKSRRAESWASAAKQVPYNRRN